MQSGERDLSLLMWFAIAAILCMSTLVLPLVIPAFATTSLELRSLGSQLGAATTGMQPSHLVQAVVVASLAATYHAQRVSGRLDG